MVEEKYAFMTEKGCLQQEYYHLSLVADELLVRLSKNGFEVQGYTDNIEIILRRIFEDTFTE